MLHWGNFSLCLDIHFVTNNICLIMVTYQAFVSWEEIAIVWNMFNHG